MSPEDELAELLGEGYEEQLTLPQLNRDAYFYLDAQFARTPAIGDGYSASGEHYRLMAVLKELGYNTNSREEAMNLAERLLANGYA